MNKIDLKQLIKEELSGINLPTITNWRTTNAIPKLPQGVKNLGKYLDYLIEEGKITHVEARLISYLSYEAEKKSASDTKKYSDYR